MNVNPPTLNFNETSDKMVKFMNSFDTFISKSRKNVLDEKNMYKRSLIEDRENQKILLSKLQSYRKKDTELNIASAREQKEIEIAKNQVSTLEIQKEQLENTKRELSNQIITTRNAISKKSEELSTKKKAIVSQSSAIEPELLKFESLIGLTVEGLDEDILRFIFHLVNQADYEQEFYFDLNLSSYDYQVIKTSPQLPNEVITPLIERLNESRNLTKFLKEMRREFKKSI